jgi:hypothetical protein
VKPSQVIIYDEPAASALDTSEIARYLGDLLPGMRIKVRSSLVSCYFQRLNSGERGSALARLALGFAKLKIKNPTIQEQEFPALSGEVDYERRRLNTPRPTYGILYHGEGVLRLLQGLIPRPERNLSYLHVVFTNQLLATWDDGRYHLRVAVFGFPSLLSTTGLVEAPAKPREFYVIKQQYAALGMHDAIGELERELGKRVLMHEDPRLTEVVKGYVMQALFYHLTGDPFCEDKGCRLFNAHWQEEVIEAQLSGDCQFCPRHQSMLDELKEREPACFQRGR